MENQTPDAVMYLPLYRNIVIKQANHKLVFSWAYGLFSLLLLLYLLLNEKSLFEFLIFVVCFVCFNSVCFGYVPSVCKKQANDIRSGR